MGIGSSKPVAEVKKTKHHRHRRHHNPRNNNNLEFHNHYWEFERNLYNGENNQIVLLRLKRSPETGQHVQGSKRRRMAVKLAKREREFLLSIEMNIMRGMNGARHIVEVVALCNDLVQAVKTRRSKRNVEFPYAPPLAFEGFVGLGGPAMAMEFLEHGSLQRLRDRVRADFRARNRTPRIPNRILWSIFLCLIRGNIGMTYPMRQGIPADPRTEQINVPQGQSGVVHNDLTLGNLMLTSYHGPPPLGPNTEHKCLGLMCKIIDFGGAGRSNKAITINMWEIAMVI
ncbi:hypothetical protein F5Y16DRAFT_232717 [Xylariaceae sp. FL0255]|nr:hypothetical protein F5Y16DRAFT_232717 [Xylariaceae sp. FL0255]